MPFVTQCPTCQGKTKMPDEWRGAIVACSKCYDSFVAIAIGEVPAPAPVAQPGEPEVDIVFTTAKKAEQPRQTEPDLPVKRRKPSAAPKAPIAKPLAVEETNAVELTEEAPVFKDDVAPAETAGDMGRSVPAPVAENPIPRAAVFAAPASRREKKKAPPAAEENDEEEPLTPPDDRINAWAMVALMLAGIACSVIALGANRWPGYTILALALGTILYGIWSRGRRIALRDACWLALATVTCLGAGKIVLSHPEWLNPRWEMDFAVAPPPATGPLLIDVDSQRVLKEMGPNDWADAELEAIRQGDLEIRIDEVRVAALTLDEPVGDAPPPTRLRIILKATNAGFLQPLTFQGPTAPRLRDNQGRSYPRVSPASKQQTLLPGHHVEEVVLFAAPPPSVGHLDLEWSVTAESAPFRFRLSREMILFPRE